jgi:hypothetical protein
MDTRRKILSLSLEAISLKLSVAIPYFVLYPSYGSSPAKDNGVRLTHREKQSGVERALPYVSGSEVPEACLVLKFSDS